MLAVEEQGRFNIRAQVPIDRGHTSDRRSFGAASATWRAAACAALLTLAACASCSPDPLIIDPASGNGAAGGCAAAGRRLDRPRLSSAHRAGSPTRSTPTRSQSSPLSASPPGGRPVGIGRRRAGPDDRPRSRRRPIRSDATHGIYARSAPAFGRAQCRRAGAFGSDPVAIAASQRLDLRPLKAGYTSQETAIRLAVLNLLPTLDVSVNDTHGAGKNLLFDSSVSLTLPLWNRNLGGIAVAKATPVALKAEYEARLTQTRAEIAAAAAALSIARSQRAARLAELPTVRRFADATRRAANRRDIAHLAMAVTW